MKRTPALFLLLIAGLAGAAHAAVAPRIQSPTADQPIFGEVEVVVGVSADEPVSRVEIFVNGVRRAVLTKPPFQTRIDVGDDNSSREFKVVAYGAAGGVGTHTVATDAIRIDEQMEVRLQQLFVTVTRGATSDSRRVLDLEQEDFRILDNGKPQEIITFGKGEVPLTAVLLLDTSESMQGERLEAARRGASVFLGGMRPDDEASLLMFSDRLLRATPFTQDRGELEQVLAETEAVGGTSVNDFLYMALKLLDSRIGRRAVILLSDGFDVHSVLPIDEVLWKARTSQSLIYWIQLDEEQKEKSFNSAWRDHKGNDHEYQTLKKTVEESGGRILNIQRIGELEHAFASILKELREQYVIGYYPTDFKKDGRWHKINVDVKRSGVKVRVREGYVDY
ncbi:MAG TPA: VWA domain-containing protein [Thermoanaerobaculia bacterium]|nr:VWA domain-containing protein [Thermoanaerobaculia bacterium]